MIRYAQFENAASAPNRLLGWQSFQYAILSGCKQIIKHEKELNKLNVFPIPDKDTGANLKKTLIPLIEKYPFPESKINLISQEMADLAFQSALGYSGIIFS